MGSAIKAMGIILAVVQGLAVLIGAVSMGFVGVIVIMIGGFAILLSTLIIIAIGETLDNTEYLRAAINTLTHKIERMEKSGDPSTSSYPASNGSQGGRSIPTWQRVEMEQQKKQQEQQEQQ